MNNGFSAITKNGRTISKCTAGVLALAAVFPLASCSSIGSIGSANHPQIQYYYVDVFTDYDVQLRIDPTGSASIIERRGIGRGDIRQTSAQVPAEELHGVWHDLGGWSSLKTAYALDFNPQIHITYGDHEVVTSNPEKSPVEFRRASDDLKQIADALIKKMDAQSAASRPAAATQIDPRTGNAF